MISCKINGYENYELFRDGSIYSHNRGGGFMTPTYNKKGYLQIKFYKNKKTKNYNIHRLLAQYFIPNPDNLPVVDHINRIRDDNRIENLRWATHSDNSLNTTRYDKPLKNIWIIKNSYRIYIKRNKLKYSKYCKTEEQAILQRDLMLSMFS